MANPRQRRKLRSGAHRPVKHSNNAKKNLKKQPPICGPKVLQEAWDRKKTVRQNYEALGLVASLNPSASGGVEQPLGAENDGVSMETARHTEASSPQAGPSSLRKGYGRIVRDAEGNVVDVEMGEDEEEESTGRLVEDIDDPSGQDGLAEWVGIGSAARQLRGDAHVVNSLQELAETRGGPVPRHSSHGELGLLRRLIDKHGADVGAMARDRRLNAAQRTAGELGRALRRAGLLDG